MIVQSKAPGAAWHQAQLNNTRRCAKLMGPLHETEAEGGRSQLCSRRAQGQGWRGVAQNSADRCLDKIQTKVAREGDFLCQEGLQSPDSCV